MAKAKQAWRRIGWGVASAALWLWAAGCVQPTPLADSGEPLTLAVVVTATPAPPQAGGTWIEASSADGSNLNPILWSDAASSDMGPFYPSLIGINPFSGAVEPREMAERWSVSPDSLVWTFHLRPDVTWSDGEAVDAHDFKYTYDAIASDRVETPRKAQVAHIESIEVIDDRTVQVTFKQLKCDALLDLGLGWLPSHLFADDFSDIMTSPLNTAPQASAGPFAFQNWVRDDYIAMAGNDAYWRGAPYMDGQIIRVIPSAGTRLAALETGEVDMIGLEPTQLTRVGLNPELNIYKFKDDGYSYIGLNLADPDNPMAAQDEHGNPQAQDPHPILSDRQVRLAMAHSLDYEAIINKVFLGQGYQIASNVLPAVEWAHDPALEPYAYDTELAASLLDAAGWTDANGDGVRECNGCATAEAGARLSLTLVTNAGNSTREELGVLVQDQLNGLGFDIAFEAIDFGTLVDELLGQTYDMVIIGWTGLGTDPNDDAFWHSRYDTPGSGFNFVSYVNPRMDELLEQGLSVPGCAAADRAPIYQEIQRIVYEDIPYLFVTGSVGNVGYSRRWQGLDPGTWSFAWNIERWSLTE